MLRPSRLSMNSSGAPTASTSGRIMRIDAMSTTAPMIPPTIETVNAAPSARPASPCCASG